MAVFVSYNHDDSRYAKELGKELHHLNAITGVVLWDDSQISPSADWRRKIEVELQRAEAAILLISNRYLGSKFCIYESEVLTERLPNRLFLLLVSKTDFKAYPHLSDLQMGPWTSERKLTSLDRLRPPERRAVYTEVGGWLRELLGPDPKPRNGPPPRFPPFTERRYKECIKGLVTRYAEDPDGALKQLCDDYIIIYDKVSFDIAREYLKKFEAGLQRAHIEVEDRSHREILELLREGPPIDVHLEGLVEVRDGATLFSHPAFPRLLLGIRKMEKSHKEAIKHLEAMRQGDMPHCALFKYVLGQCYRKVKQLYDAQYMLETASRDAERCKEGCCMCIVPGCRISELRLAIYRGRGAVHRELKEWDKAERCFQDALRYVEDENVSKYIRNSIKCDFYYTFGYYMFKRSFGQGDRQKFYLRKALKRFGDAHQLCQDRSAPLSRIAIVEHLLHEIGGEAPNRTPRTTSRIAIVKHLLHEAIFKDFLDAWHLTLVERNIEAPLTAAMCGFGLLMMDLGNANLVLNEEQLYDNLEHNYQTRYFPLAALDCHAFDIKAILGQRELPKDEHPWLYRVYQLLQESTTWGAKDLDKQKAHLEEFRVKYGIPGKR